MTRIASVKPHPISVPLTDVLWTAHEELKASSVIVVEVRTDDGLIGFGQIHGSPMKASSCLTTALPVRRPVPTLRLVPLGGWTRVTCRSGAVGC